MKLHFRDQNRSLKIKMKKNFKIKIKLDPLIGDFDQLNNKNRNTKSK